MGSDQWEMKSPFRQLRPLLVWLAPALGVIGLVALIAARHQASVAQMTCDPSALGRLPAWSGWVSKLGIACWAMAFTSCLLAARLLRHLGAERDAVALLGWTGAVSLAFFIDDEFMLHEMVGAAFGCPDHYFFVVHAGLLGILLLRCRRRILASDWLFLGCGLGGLFLSLLMDADLYRGSTYQRRLLVEDGAKFLGIVAWCGFALRSSWQELTQLGARLPGRQGFLHYGQDQNPSRVPFTAEAPAPKDR